MDYLKQQGSYEQIGGAAYIAGDPPKSAYGGARRYYARIVVRHAKMRTIIRAGTDLIRDAYDPQAKPDDVLDAAGRDP